MKKDLPIYSIHINELENMIVDVVSIVAHPAIEKNFLAFSDDSKIEKTSVKYQFSNDEKMQLLGVALVPDKPIYRKMDGEEFYVVFTKEEIENIVHVFMKKGLTKSLNVEHSNKDANSYIFQSFIVDEKIQAPLLLGDVPVGSWIIGVQVEDVDLWKDIKAGKRNGFSIEGLFQMLLTDKVIKEGEELVEISIEQEEPTDEEIQKLYSQLSNYFKYLSK